MSARQRKRRRERRRHAASPGNRRSRIVAGTSLALGATLGAAPAAQAEIFEVTNLLDDGSAGSLREAVDDANAAPGGDTVLFNSGVSGNLNLVSGEIEIEYSTDIVGPGAKRVTVNASDDAGIFVVYPSGMGPGFFTKVGISGLTLSGGDPTNDYGGAILAKYSSVNVTDTVITGNEADDFGGGIAMFFGNLAVESSVISGNASAGGGGGIAAKYALELSIHDSTVSGNEADSAGGGVAAALGSRLDVVNSTISNNTSGGGAGGIFNYQTFATVQNSTLSGNTAQVGGGILTYSDCYCSDGKLTVRNSTIADNSAVYAGGGIYQENPPGYSHTLLLNTIAAENTAPTGPNLYGDNSSDFNAAFSLVDDASGTTINDVTPGSNLIGADPELGPLADNGGPTRTMALAPFSPAVDAGNGKGAIQDQRHRLRPVEFPNVPNSSAPGADGADIGAYELQNFPTCQGLPATIVARPGVTTVGTNSRDIIVGTRNKDLINARGGNDVVCARGGDDHVKGQAGADRLLGMNGRDELRGGGGSDRMIGGAGADEGNGGAGADTFAGQNGPDLLKGGPGPDRLLGRNGPDEMVGGPGSDRLVGGPQSDLFNGGPGLNLLYLRPRDDDVVVNRGPNDRVFGAGR